MQIFSIVVFGSIVNECYVNRDSQNSELLCIFNENESACSYGIAVGIIAFFGCIFFFVVDLYFQQISSVKDRKRAVLLDLGFSGMSLALLCLRRTMLAPWQCRVVAVPCSSTLESSPLVPQRGMTRVPLSGRTGVADGLSHPAMSSETAMRKPVCGSLGTVGFSTRLYHFCNWRCLLSWIQ